MRKIFKLFVVALFLLLQCQLLVSCGSEEEGGGGSSGGVVSALKASKWITRGASYGEGDNYHAWVDLESTTLYFTSDTDGVLYWVQKDYDTDLGNSRNYDYESFTYSVSGNEITISTENSSFRLSYAKDYLTFDDGVYEKLPLTSSDTELLRKIAPKTGSCGSGLTYVYTPKDKCLKISGQGRMADYTENSQPWHDCYIESVEIDAGCTYVGNNAFSGKSELMNLSLPKSLTAIGEYAFAGTTITKIVVPDNVTVIGGGAFLGCKYMQVAYLSDNLKEVGDGAFDGCSIKNHNLTLPPEVEIVGDNAFGGWQAGTLKLNDKLRTVGNNAFVGVKGTVTIPNSVESIGYLAFDGTFTKVVIGTGLKKMTKGAFGGSLSSGNMYVNLGIPLEVDGDIMASGNQYKWTLYVPKGSKAAYKADKYWGGFQSVIEDASLTSGNGMPESGGGEGGETPLVPKYDYRNLTYTIDGETYRMILVDGGTLPPFYIMQTELPPDAGMMVGDSYIGTLNADVDYGVIKSEFRVFLDKLREATGIAFRLPTTSEWMFAAKGGKKSKGYKYSGSDVVGDVAWYKSNSNGRVHEVAKTKANELGLYDMSGNYSEVTNDTQDLYHIDGYLCGGNWSDSESCCKSSYAVAQPSGGKMGNTRYKNKNAFNPYKETVRLVYSVPAK